MTDSLGFDDGQLERFADLVIGFGANVQRGQIVGIGAELGKEPMVRALAASAYRHGARFVDVAYFDMHVKRARIEHADEDTLDFVPPWYSQRLLGLSDAHAARIGLTGPANPGLLDGLDPRRAGRDHLPALPEAGQVVNARTTNWTAVPCPTPGWARIVHPDLPEDDALRMLVRQVMHMCRMDEDDPIAAWSARIDELVGVAGRLTERRFDALHFEGPGTDLTVGLLPTSRFIAARFETVDGVVHIPNLPTEEVFSAPDPRRTDGVVRSTKPLVVGGSIVTGLEVEFRDGAVTRIDADENADVLRTRVDRDEGASRLGEVALVDGQGRIGALDTVFFDTLIDENAASHIALGSAYSFTAGEEDQGRLNESEIHIDFMIGSDDVTVTGLSAAGDRTPVLARGAWQV